jgi:hypothetical protein
MRQMMRGLGQLVRDVGYGIHAGNAIRHGLPTPEGARRRPNQQPGVARATVHAWTAGRR